MARVSHFRNPAEQRRHLDKGLDEADQKGWLVVDMARDWKVIYPDGN